MVFQEERCSCEAVSRSEHGVVDGHERLARVVLSPQHVGKGGNLKLGLFPPSQIHINGVSLTRADCVDRKEMHRQATQLASSRPGAQVVQGVVVASTASVRAVVDNAQRREFCAFDDPTDDNPAHATVISSVPRATDAEVLGLRGELFALFSPLQKIDDLYPPD